MNAEERVAEILAEWTARLDRGETVDPEDVVRQHPELEMDLREGFVALELIDLALGKAQPDPAHPTAIGPYRITDVLGAGGMGTVYCAESTGEPSAVHAGERVALKVIHPHLLRAPGFFKRFLREAELGRLVTHSNVVRTLDVDALECDGVAYHFLVMEYVEGRTLLDLLEDLGCVPEELCRHIGREVARGLAAIHEAGAIHRDLKPENVLITPDHVVKVMDLGVARLADEQMRLSRTGMFVGSLLYAAPEQINRGDADARCDLYALGLVLYELATGQHPFRSDEPAEVLRRQLEAEPRKAGEVNPQLSPFFEELCHTLLAKNREARIPSAADLVCVLDQGEDGNWWKSRAKAIRHESNRPLRRIHIPRETALYGREAEVAQLRGLYERARAGDGRVVLLEGEAGIGKTRLVDEVVAGLRAEGEDFELLYGSYPPGGAGGSTGAISHALREHLGAESLDEALGRVLPDSPALVPALAALLRGEPTPAGVSSLSRDGLHTAFVRTLRGLAAERTVVLLVDDLHFAADESLALFSALAQDVPSHRILLLGTQRPGVPAGWKTAVTRMEATSLIGLARLGPKDVGRLLEDAFNSPRLAEELGYRILTKSDGNPFFVFEIIRGMRDGNLLRQRPDGTWVTTRIIEELEVPSSVVDLVKARVSGLSREDRSLLDVAACAGHEFDPLIVGRVVGLAAIPALQTLADMETQHRLLRSAGRRMLFDHHQVQETLYEALPELLREEYHAAIGEELERAVREPDAIGGAVALEICDHFLRGSRGKQAHPHLMRAVDHLEDNHLHGGVAALCQRALALDGLEEIERRLPVLLHAIEATGAIGKVDVMDRLLGEAEALAETKPGGLALRVRAQRAFHHFLTGKYEEARRACRDASALARAQGETAVQLKTTGLLGVLLSQDGQLDEAETTLEEVRKLAREQGDDSALAGATSNLGMVLMEHGRQARAEPILRDAIEIAREAGVRRFECIAIGNLGGVLMDMGRFREASELLDQHRVLSREIGYRRGEMIALGNQASLLTNLGRTIEAREVEDMHLRLCRETGDVISEIESLGRLSQMSSDEGNLGDALAKADEQLERARDAEDVALIPRALNYRGDALLWLGAYDAAEDALQQALSRAGELPQVRVRALRGLTAVCGARGDIASMRRFGEEALGVARECSDLVMEIGCRLDLIGLDLDDPDRDADPGEIGDLLERARETGVESLVVTAVCLLARATGVPADVDRAERTLAEAELPPADRLHVLLALHGLRPDPDRLREAKRLLAGFIDLAPPEYRESIVENVPLYRDVMRAEMP